MDGKIGTVAFDLKFVTRSEGWEGEEEEKEVEEGDGGEIGLREYSFFSFCAETDTVTCTGSVETRVAFTRRCSRRDYVIL